jgi:hypothetical protein
MGPADSMRWQHVWHVPRLHSGQFLDRLHQSFAGQRGQQSRVLAHAIWLGHHVIWLERIQRFHVHFSWCVFLWRSWIAEVGQRVCVRCLVPHHAIHPANNGYVHELHVFTLDVCWAAYFIMGYISRHFHAGLVLLLSIQPAPELLERFQSNRHVKHVCLQSVQQPLVKLEAHCRGVLVLHVCLQPHIQPTT